MSNLRVAQTLELIADLIEIQGVEPFKAPAYRRAAHSVRKSAEDVSQLAREGRLLELGGVGKNLAPKIEEILATGSCRYLERLQLEIPLSILELLAVPGLGPRTASLLFRELGVTSLEALETALAGGQVEKLPGMGAKKTAALSQGLADVKKQNTGRRPLGWVLPFAESLREHLSGVDAVADVEICGSARRWKETVGDLDLVAASEDAKAVMEHFLALPGVSRVLASGQTRSSVFFEQVGQVDLRVVEPAHFAPAVHHFTGSAEHHVHLRGLARRQGLHISEYGVKAETGADPVVSDERQLYALLGLDYIPPELREDRGEIEASAAKELPCLVHMSDIRGDLHVHSDWSDGSAGLQQLAAAAAVRGYQYLAVTDHSRSLAMARGLDAQRLSAQVEAIAQVNVARPDGPRLLTGIEVDILRDGSLDLDDDILSGLDVVVASIHSGLRQDPGVLTSRLEQAIKNPHVDIIGHPTGRLLSGREPALPDLEHLFDVASATGTAFEINASPDRLDLNDIWARKAKEHGVKLAVSSDAHSLSGLSDLRYGLGTARRAWLEAPDILNCCSLDSLLKS